MRSPELASANAVAPSVERRLPVARAATIRDRRVGLGDAAVQLAPGTVDPERLSR
jgi:hypothetical protein